MMRRNCQDRALIFLLPEHLKSVADLLHWKRQRLLELELKHVSEFGLVRCRKLVPLKEDGLARQCEFDPRVRRDRPKRLFHRGYAAILAAGDTESPAAGVGHKECAAMTVALAHSFQSTIWGFDPPLRATTSTCRWTFPDHPS